MVVGCPLTKKEEIHLPVVLLSLFTSRTLSLPPPLQLKCTASIFDLYSQSTEKVLVDGDSLLSAQESSVSSGGGASSNSFNGQENSYALNNSVYNSPQNHNNNNVNMFQSSDPYSMHDFESYGGRQENKKEAYMTPIHGKRICQCSTSSSCARRWPNIELSA